MGILNFNFNFNFDFKRGHVTGKLAAYLHGELTPAERARVMAHLKTCETCRAALAAEEALAARLRAQFSPLTHPRPGQLARLWPGIAARIANTRPPRRMRFAHRSVFGMALTASLLCVMLLPLLLGGRVPVSRADGSATQAAFTGPTLPPGAATAIAQLPGDTATAPSTHAGQDSPGATVTPVPTPETKG
ncbi:MAG: zf-HC2 domain-containing protein [Anaerolineae bacterium]|nr:zf-HC2 domain-containing protein [Anaerolineae bacterium]